MPYKGVVARGAAQALLLPPIGAQRYRAWSLIAGGEGSASLVYYPAMMGLERALGRHFCGRSREWLVRQALKIDLMLFGEKRSGAEKLII